MLKDLLVQLLGLRALEGEAHEDEGVRQALNAQSDRPVPKVGETSLQARSAASKAQIYDIELSVYHILRFKSVCPFVALSKAEFAENVHIVLSSPY